MIKVFIYMKTKNLNTNTVHSDNTRENRQKFAHNLCSKMRAFWCSLRDDGAMTESDPAAFEPDGKSPQELLEFLEQVDGLKGRKALNAKLHKAIETVRGDFYVRLRQVFLRQLGHSPAKTKPDTHPKHRPIKSLRKGKVKKY
jgi:hypothetical protein